MLRFFIDSGNKGYVVNGDSNLLAPLEEDEYGSKKTSARRGVGSASSPRGAELLLFPLCGSRSCGFFSREISFGTDTFICGRLFVVT